MSTNLTHHDHKLYRKERTRLKAHQPAALWFTGLSASGKSTIANEVEWRLAQDYNCHTYLLDGDNVRRGLNHNLGFSDADRHENIRRFGEVAWLFVDAGLIVMAALISPFRSDRAMVRERFAQGEFFEIYVACSIDVCAERDPKGLYEKARRGEVPEFTGISSPYEPPEAPDLVLHSDQHSAEECALQVLSFLEEKGIISRKNP